MVGRCRGPLAAAIVLLLGCGCQQRPEGWSERDRRVLATLSLSGLTLPSTPSNRFGDEPLARALGKRLFFDLRLSGDRKRSCASCHIPDRGFVDGLARPQGSELGSRNTPTVVGAAYGAWFYWDGRRDSLWSQALIPFEAPAEMGGSRVAVVRTLLSDPAYRSQLSALLGSLPPPAWGQTLPLQAGPYGDPATQAAWGALSAPDQHRVNQLYATAGKAIAAFERTLLLTPGPLDRYVDGLSEDRPEGAKSDAELTRKQKEGLALFISDRTRCLRCHNGPRLTNDGFHNIGTGKLEGEGRLDFGRALGVQAVLLDEFNCRGKYSDARQDDCTQLRFLSKADHGDLRGAFKVPSLRLVGRTAPYFHDGRFRTLEEVVRFYNEPGAMADGMELEPMGLNEGEVSALVAFLSIL